MKTTLPFLIFLSVIFFICPLKSVHASHAAGCELQYQCIGPNQYKIILKFYRDCTGINAPSNPTVQLKSDSLCGSSTINVQLYIDTVLSCGTANAGGCEVKSPVCPAYISQAGCHHVGTSPATYPGMKFYYYSGIVTLPYPCSKWLLRYTENARNPSDNILNSTLHHLSLQDLINNSIDPSTGQPIMNNSVEFSTMPVLFVCANSPVWYNHGAFDVDGDSLSFALTTPLGTGYVPLTFNSGWGVNQPIRTSPPGGMVFTTHTGQLSFTPSQVEVDVLAVKVSEYRNGTLIGTTTRDMQISILNCQSYLPVIGGVENTVACKKIDSTTINVCYGDTASFEIGAHDTWHNNLTLTSDLHNDPYLSVNAVGTQVGSGDTVLYKVTWTPQAYHYGCRSFLLTAENDNCPVYGSYTKEFRICVDSGLQVTATSPVYCGSPVQLNASGGNNITWAPAIGLTNPSELTTWAQPLLPTTYVASSTCGTDSIFINVVPLMNVDAGADTMLCSLTPVLLTGSYTAQPGSKVFWSASSLLSDTLYYMAGYHTAGLTSSLNQTGMHYFHVIYNNGCHVYDSANVMRLVPPRVTAFSTDAVVCPMVADTLVGAVNYAGCGINNTISCTMPEVINAGNNQALLPLSAISYPAVYGNYKHSAHHQFLYYASELNGGYGRGGGITDLFFNVTQFATQTTLKNFTIKMGCSTKSELTQWETNLVEVFAAKDVTVSGTGWQQHHLDNVYEWNGVSNIVVDICFYNPDTNLIIHSRTAGSYTTKYSVLYNSEDLGSACMQPTIDNDSKLRPDIRFNLCAGNYYPGPVQWSSLSGSNSISNSTSTIATYLPLASDTFKLSVVDTLTGCVASDTLIIPMSVSSLVFKPRPATCGNNNGKILLNMFGTYTPFSVVWNHGSTGNSLSGLAPGVYVAQVTDAVGCVMVDSTVVGVAPAPLVTTTFTNPLCYGTATGTAGVSFTGGTAPVTVLWANGLGSANFINNLPAGTYIVSVTDSNTCKVTDTLKLVAPPLLTTTITATPACYGAINGTANASVSGGVPPFSFSWSGGLGNSNPLINMAPGNYIVVVTDSNNCLATDSVLVTEADSIAYTISAQSSVCGQSTGIAEVTIQGNAVYNLAWAGGSSAWSLTNIPTGYYTFTITDSTGCSLTDSVFVDCVSAINGLEGNSLNIYPNPVRTYFTLLLNDVEGKVTVQSELGQHIYTATAQGVQHSVNCSDWASGIYYVTVTDKTGNVTGRASVVKE